MFFPHVNIIVNTNLSKQSQGYIMPLFLLAAAPLVAAGSTTAIAGGALAAAIVAYPIHRFNQFIDSFESSDPSPSLSTESRESLHRQDEMLTNRQSEAEIMLQQAEFKARNAATQYVDLLIEERDTGEHLSSASSDIVDAAAKLEEVLLMNAALQEQIKSDTERYEKLLANFQAVTAQLAEAISAREEDNRIKAALQSKLDLLTDSAARTEAELQQINVQLQDLVTLTQHQAKTIQILQCQKSELIKNHDDLYDGVMQLTQSNLKYTAELKKLNDQLESLQKLTTTQAKTIKTLQKQKAGLIEDNNALNEELILLAKLQASTESPAANRTQFFR